MDSNDNFRKKLIKLVITISILFFVVGASFAFFSSRVVSNPQDITVGKLDLSFNDSTPWVNITNMFPIIEEEILSNASKKTFSITNTGNINEYVDINLEELTISTNLRVFDMKWALYEGDTKITTGTFLNGNSDINLISNILFTPLLTKTFNLYVWINESDNNQIAMSERAEGESNDPSISLKITANGLHKKLDTLSSKYDFINAKTDLNFNSNSTNNGLYVQKDDSSKSEFGFPTYFFKGNVNNNYVSFAGLIWRIIKFNEDGSIKIITENKPNTLSNIAYDTAGTTSDYLLSSIKSSIDTWYSSTITSTYLSKISNSMFCNDITSSSMNRISTSVSPSFSCNYGSNKVVSNVGTITADEILFAGGLFNSVVTDNITYLNNSEQFYTLTKGDDISKLFAWGIDGSYLNTYSVSNTYGIRPVVNLKQNVIVSSGDGSITDPYIIN